MISKTTTKSKKFKEIEKKDGTIHKDNIIDSKRYITNNNRSTERKLRHNIR